MIRTVYQRLPGPPLVRLALMTFAALVLLGLVIWSYEVLGDLLDTGGTIE